MIDPALTKVFHFECPSDSLTRKHRYMLYYKRRFLGKFYNITKAYQYIDTLDYDSFVLTWQYLGADNYFHTFQKEYLYPFKSQFSLF